MKNKLLFLSAALLMAGCADLSQQLQNYNATQEDALLKSYGFQEKHVIQYHKPANTQWAIGHRELRGSKLLAYIPQDESMSTWTQSIYEIYIPGLEHPPAYYFDDTQSIIKKICTESSLKMLSQSNLDIAYVLTGTGCKDGDRVSAMKIFQGDDGIYMLQYFAIPGKVSAATIDEGIKTVSESDLN